MVAIRLSRLGGRNDPYYRIVAADSRSKRDGRCIEVIGTWRPSGATEAVTFEADRLRHWLSVGAQPSDTVRRLIRSSRVLKPAVEQT